MAALEIDLTVYPDECDAFGHLNQASFLSLFERARWEMLARGPGMDVFTVQGTWPAVRKTAIDYHAPAFPGDVLRFHQALTHHGRTSFTMRQTARRVRDDILIATAEFVFVCVSRNGSFAITWCVRMGKYDSNVRPFTRIFPLPFRIRTRATASLRRPVVWIRGLGKRGPCSEPSRRHLHA